MFEALFGIGFRALAGKALGNAAGDLKAVGKWLGSLDLVHLCLLIAVLFGAWQTFGRWSQHRHTAKVEGQLTATTKALTAVRTDLATSQANEKVLRGEIAKQNASIIAISQKSIQAQNAAAIARKAAEERANDAQRSAEALRQSAASSALKTAPACEPSDELKKRWPS